ncbi:MAG: diguanylate cyclase [Timaviella obliquedivisa GSE-PSE-MK23-08B]|jgi:diguanylate cyclase (GGDEF)-like protein|nr:diguanylate cyclase [Timaviella obliquedivisa GSE-PSE-MK23-08B]
MNQRLTVFLSSNILLLALMTGIGTRLPAVSAQINVGQPAIAPASNRQGALGNVDSTQQPVWRMDETSRLNYQEAERLLNQLTTLIFIVGLFLGLIISLLLDKTIRDNHRLRLATQELERLANLDGLTQIANRRCFEAHLQQEWARAVREKNSLTLILCDVDHFRLYNETYGHQAGDECLRQLALVLNRTAKRPGDLAARYGDEEFAIILPNTNTSGGIVVAHSIQEAVAQLQLSQAGLDGGTSISLSFGVATVVPSQELSSAMLTELSDRALYTAKERGRNQIVCLEQNVRQGDRSLRSSEIQPTPEPDSYGSERF